MCGVRFLTLFISVLQLLSECGSTASSAVACPEQCVSSLGSSSNCTAAVQQFEDASGYEICNGGPGSVCFRSYSCLLSGEGEGGTFRRARLHGACTPATTTASDTPMPEPQLELGESSAFCHSIMPEASLAFANMTCQAMLTSQRCTFAYFSRLRYDPSVSGARKASAMRRMGACKVDQHGAFHYDVLTESSNGGADSGTGTEEVEQHMTEYVLVTEGSEAPRPKSVFQMWARRVVLICSLSILLVVGVCVVRNYVRARHYSRFERIG